MKKIIGIYFCFVISCVLKAQDGSLDLSFGTGGKVLTGISGFGCSIAIQTDGKIIYCGSVNNGSTYDITVCRFNSDGSFDTGFGTSGIVFTDIDSSNQEAKDVAIQTDGKILVIGNTNVSGNQDFLLVRYNVDGTLDTTFNSTGILKVPIGTIDDYARSLRLQPDGKILVSGHSNNSMYADFAIIRVNVNGTLDATFDGDGKCVVDVGGEDDLNAQMALQTDGKIVLSGDIWVGANFYDFGSIRLMPDGSFDTGFGTGGKVVTDGFTGFDNYATPSIQADGKIIVGGTIDNSTNNFGLMKYDGNGNLDLTFDGDAKVTNSFGGIGSVAYSLAIQADGKIIQAGHNYGDFGLMRYHANGSLDTAFGSAGKVLTDFSGTTDYAYAMALQTDAKIVVAGTSDGFFSMARYNVSPVGISENIADITLSVFPNPTNTAITISTAEIIENATAKITNATGDIIFSKDNLSGNSFSFDVSNLVEGVYFIELNAGQKVSRTKFIRK